MARPNTAATHPAAALSQLPVNYVHGPVDRGWVVVLETFPMSKLVTYGVVALFAVYLPAALWLKAAYVSDEPKGQIVVQILPPFQRDGLAFVNRAPPLDQLLVFGDSENVEGDHSSNLMIYEGLARLGPAHNTYADIRDFGMGRFSHWRHQGVIFSASDGSNPNTNGRHYWAVLPFVQPQVSVQAP